jgi:ABC-type uncharacterized transport system permease subunit
MIATLVLTASEFAAIALVLQRFEGIGGWSLGEIAFLYGMMNAAFAPFVAPLVGVGLLLASLAFWRFGLRHYTGTGT